MKRREFIQQASAIGTVSTTALITGAPAIASGKIEWKLPTSFPVKAPGIGTNVSSFAARVAAMSNGRLTFRIYSGGEMVPPFGVEESVQQGIAEIGHSTPYYAAGKNPALNFFSTVPFGMSATEHVAWLRFGGGQALWEKLYAQRGLIPFYSGNSGTQSGGWFSKPVNSLDDLKGLTMRIAGLGGEAMRSLGVNAVLLSPPEIFPAFKSGAIDAAEWVGPMLDQSFGLHELAKLCYIPAFHEPAAALEIVVNADAYNELPADLQAIIANAAEASSVETLAQFDYFNAQAMIELKEAGVEFREYPDDVVSALRDATAVVMTDLAQENEDFNEVMLSYNAYLEVARDYANMMQGAMYRQRTVQ
ncbi:MAG: TRAP transporter substrate-binding protein [Granulosicoccus sp.]